MHFRHLKWSYTQIKRISCTCYRRGRGGHLWFGPNKWSIIYWWKCIMFCLKLKKTHYASLYMTIMFFNHSEWSYTLNLANFQGGVYKGWGVVTCDFLKFSIAYIAGSISCLVSNERKFHVHHCMWHQCYILITLNKATYWIKPDFLDGFYMSGGGYPLRMGQIQ